jgi:hypothetical protein
MPVWPCAVRAVRNGRLCTKILRSPGNLPVSGYRFSAKAVKERGRPAVTDLPFNVVAVMPARQFCACWTCPPILTLLYVIEKSVLESKVDLQMLITC